MPQAVVVTLVDHHIVASVADVVVVGRSTARHKVARGPSTIITLGLMVVVSSIAHIAKSMANLDTRPIVAGKI
jgi:hypothetical protein